MKKKKKELEDKAGKKCVWAIGLAFILFIYLVATLALCAVAELDLIWHMQLVKATGSESSRSCRCHSQQHPIPTLNSKKTAGFLSVMEQEFKEFNGKAEKARATATNCIIHL